MSAKKTYTLVCNAPGCTSIFQPTTVEVPERAAEVRQASERAGWSYSWVPAPPGGRSASLDFCPVHRP